jgi:hypothetical protein
MSGLSGEFAEKFAWVRRYAQIFVPGVMLTSLRVLISLTQRYGAGVLRKTSGRMPCGRRYLRFAQISLSAMNKKFLCAK